MYLLLSWHAITAPEAVQYCAFRIDGFSSYKFLSSVTACIKVNSHLLMR